MKDLCYLRLVRMINDGNLSFSESVANRTYTHQNLTFRVAVQNEFLEECAVVRFTTLMNGRQRLLTKKQMNATLGRGRSMDLLDPCAMRMRPCIEMEYGRELEYGFNTANESVLMQEPTDVSQTVYDDTIWY